MRQVRDLAPDTHRQRLSPYSISLPVCATTANPHQGTPLDCDCNRYLTIAGHTPLITPYLFREG